MIHICELVKYLCDDTPPAFNGPHREGCSEEEIGKGMWVVTGRLGL